VNVGRDANVITHAKTNLALFGTWGPWTHVSKTLFFVYHYYFLVFVCVGEVFGNMAHAPKTCFAKHILGEHGP